MLNLFLNVAVVINLVLTDKIVLNGPLHHSPHVVKVLLILVITMMELYVVVIKNQLLSVVKVILMIATVMLAQNALNM